MAGKGHGGLAAGAGQAGRETAAYSLLMLPGDRMGPPLDLASQADLAVISVDELLANTAGSRPPQLSRASGGGHGEAPLAGRGLDEPRIFIQPAEGDANNFQAS